jgi:hypothetical protein
MKIIPFLSMLTALAALSLPTTLRADEDGVALAIIYDTSGSMRESVRDSSGNSSPKYVIANRALVAIAHQIQTFATNNAADKPRKIECTLFTFQGEGASTAIPLGPFDAQRIEDWAKSFSKPGGGTPLGNALTTASQTILNSPLSRKHVLVITDGNNTLGPTPGSVMPVIKQQADRKHANISVHFVAFDVDAKVFDPVKRLGATVVSAANETQLNTQLDFILQKKILLEEEESPKTK